MNQQQKQALEAIAMDMWKPDIKAVREQVPHVQIVFDCFHVVQAFNRVIDKVRVTERKKAEKSQQEVYKGTRYLLLATNVIFAARRLVLICGVLWI